jgi:hypothetical protein
MGLQAWELILLKTLFMSMLDLGHKLDFNKEGYKC